MTKLTGPFNIGVLDSETTVFSIDVSGTATYAGNIDVVGDANITGSLIVSAGMAITGTAQVVQGGQAGKIEVVQQATLIQSHTAAAPLQMNLPTGVNLTDVLIDVEVPFGTPAGVTAAIVETVLGTATAASILGKAVVSASGRYAPLNDRAGGEAGGSMTLMRNLVFGTVETFVSIQDSATAISVGQAIITLKYIV